MTDDPDDGASYLVTARAPLRVSLAGGGTDLPSYAQRHGGLVVSLAINRYVSVTVYPRSFDGGVRLSAEETEQAGHAGLLRNQFVRAALLRTGLPTNLQVVSCSDAPSGTGLGGSGAFTVALLHALLHRRHPPREELAEHASAVEMRDLGRPVGKMDHYMASYGGLRALHIDPDQRLRVEEVAVGSRLRAYIHQRLLLFYTGGRRDAGKILAAQDRQTRAGDEETLHSLRTIHTLVPEMMRAVRTESVDDIGPILDEHWRSKLRLGHHVSNTRVNDLYRLALKAGADGGKLLGAGGGGFLLISCRAGRGDEIRAEMNAHGAREMTFDLDLSGSQAAALQV